MDEKIQEKFENREAKQEKIQEKIEDLEAKKAENRAKLQAQLDKLEINGFDLRKRLVKQEQKQRELEIELRQKKDDVAAAKAAVSAHDGQLSDLKARLDAA
ncbi:MAG: hypothetical protein HQL53_12490 [Magnetococcales bacterium]|nr:hypothetical protein [Magnetococcales bacterium]